jgi:hypothetical protein
MRSAARAAAPYILTLALVACSPNETPKESATPPAQDSAGLTGKVETGNKTKALGSQEFALRSERIRTFFKERAPSVAEIVTTTRTDSGQTIYWIRPESQLPSGVKLELPPPPSKMGKPADAAKIGILTKPPTMAEHTARTEVQVQKTAQGPLGTVPVVQFNIEHVLRLKSFLPENPAEVLSKTPPPSPDTNDRYYGVWKRTGKFYGSAGRINIWDTDGPISGETSIAQTAILRGSPMQGIEAGKIELEGLNDSSRPYFFTFYRTNDGATGDWVGGYNTTVKGWIQVSPTVAPGMSLVNWSSQSGGAQYSLDVEVRLWKGNWWVWAAGEWAGYYPHCVGGGGGQACSGPTLFSANGIRDQADRLDWYAEVYDSTAKQPTSTDMGSGAFAADGWGKAAYFRNLTYFWQPNTYWWWDSGNLSETDSGCYSVEGPFYSQSDPNYHNWWYVGGPGKEAATCK